MAFFHENFDLENLLSFKKLFKKLLKHQNIEIDVALLLKAYNPPSKQLNGFNAINCKQHMEWLEFNKQLFAKPEYRQARDILVFTIRLITDFYADKVHYSGNAINDELIMDSFDIFYIHKECAKLIKAKYIEESSQHAKELKLYKDPIRPWFRDLIIPYKHEIEKYDAPLNKYAMAEKYTNMIQCNRYPAPFSKSLPMSIAGTEKTPICKIMKVLLSLLKNYTNCNNVIIFPYIELINSLLRNEEYINNLITYEILDNHYKKTLFYEKYNQFFHKNIITENLSKKKSDFLLIFLNSQIKI